MNNNMEYHESLGILIRDALNKIPSPVIRRALTKAVYEKLKSHTPIRLSLEAQFVGPIKCRYAGCPPVEKGKKRRKVLGYLWDFSFSRYDIPAAIEQDGPVALSGKYELLLVVESELGTSHEICRDLLKLIEARAAIRCLIFKHPARDWQRLHDRMIRVLHNHAQFRPGDEQWLFFGLLLGSERVQAQAYTLTADGSQLIQLQQ